MYFTSRCAILPIRVEARNLEAETMVQSIPGFSSGIRECRIETCKEIEVGHAKGPICVSIFSGLSWGIDPCHALGRVSAQPSQ
jgi:hypothetical protein